MTCKKDRSANLLKERIQIILEEHGKYTRCTIRQSNTRSMQIMFSVCETELLNLPSIKTNARMGSHLAEVVLKCCKASLSDLIPLDLCVNNDKKKLFLENGPSEER